MSVLKGEEPVNGKTHLCEKTQQKATGGLEPRTRGGEGAS